MFNNINASITTSVENKHNGCICTCLDLENNEKYLIPSFDIVVNISSCLNAQYSDNIQCYIQPNKLYECLLAITFDQKAFQEIKTFILDTHNPTEPWPKDMKEIWLSQDYKFNFQPMPLPNDIKYFDLALLIKGPSDEYAEWQVQTIKRINIDKKPSK